MNPLTESDFDNRARLSWLCPLIAWGSQVISVLALRGVPGLGVFWLLMCLIQIGLVGAGLYFGAMVLKRGRSVVPSAKWWSAVLGVVLSSGTILLVLALIFVSRMR